MAQVDLAYSIMAAAKHRRGGEAMELKFILAADAANISREGKLNITGEFNTFHGSAQPVVHPFFKIVARIEANIAEGLEHAGMVKIVDEDGKPIVQSPPFPLMFGSGGRGIPARANLDVGIVGVAFPKFGDYGVHVFVDGVQRGQLTLYVREATAPQSELPPEQP